MTPTETPAPIAGAATVTPTAPEAPRADVPELTYATAVAPIDASPETLAVADVVTRAESALAERIAELGLVDERVAAVERGLVTGERRRWLATAQPSGHVPGDQLERLLPNADPRTAEGLAALEGWRQANPQYFGVRVAERQAAVLSSLPPNNSKLFGDTFARELVSRTFGGDLV